MANHYVALGILMLELICKSSKVREGTEMIKICN